MNFNAVDLSTYGVKVVSIDPGMGLGMSPVQLPRRAYANDSVSIPKVLTVGVQVTGATLAELLSRLDSIKGVLNERTDKHLILDAQTGRYWMCRFNGLQGGLLGPLMFAGTLTFTATDPMAYSVEQTITPHTINADTKVIVETVAGSGPCYPVFTLVPGAILSGVSITLRVVKLDMELTWSGSLAATDELVIDSYRWYVSVNGTNDMKSITPGAFPYLVPGANSIQVSGLGTAGTLSIRYRNRYL